MNFNAAFEEETPAEVLPATVQPLTLDAVKPKFQPYLVRVREMADEAKTVEVSDDNSLKYAVSLGGDAKKIAKAIETLRKKIIQEPSDFVKVVNNFCKLFMEQLAQTEAVLKKKISDYQYQQEIDRRKREEAARKAAAELQAKLHREAEEANRKAREEAAKKAEEEARARAASEAEIAAAKAKAEEDAKAREIQAPVVQAPIIPTESKVTRTETGTAAYQRKTWKAEVTDENLVPREYLVPDIKKINEAVRMGTRIIPGVRIWEELSTVFRS